MEVCHTLNKMEINCTSNFNVRIHPAGSFTNSCKKMKKTYKKNHKTIKNSKKSHKIKNLGIHSRGRVAPWISSKKIQKKFKNKKKNDKKQKNSKKLQKI